MDRGAGPIDVLMMVLASLLLQGAANPGERFTHFAGFDLGKATLADVQARYGPSRVRESGDAGEYEAWVCYSTPDGEVQFNSGEMGGGTDLIGFTLGPPSPTGDCPKPRQALPYEISGMRPGLTRAEFMATLDNPVEWTGDIGTSRFDYQSRTPDGVPLDVSITILATFRDGKLIRLAAWKIETT
jgi:hypothetical protein